MYNRYIPQPDGTYRKSRIPEAASQHAARPTQQTLPPPQIITEQVLPNPPPPKPLRPHSGYRQAPESVTGFLRQLLPKNIDTGDLMIILLLLLMAGDCEENRNNALLTLAIYFFL